jgi:membrane protein
MREKVRQLHESILRKLIRRGQKIVLPGFEGVPLYDVVSFFIKKVNTVGLNERASAISFNFFMAIPPACIFLFSLVPLMPWADDFSMEIMRVVNDITPDKEVRKAVRDFIDDFFGRPRNSLLSVGFLIAIFYSSSAMLGIIHTFNRSIHEKEVKGFMVYRWKAIKLTFMIMLLFIASMLILMTQGAMFETIMQWLHIDNKFTQILIGLLRWVVVFGLFFYSIAFIYRHAPMVEKKWKLISPGSIVACSLMIILTSIFSAWINQFGGYNKVYGSIGTIMMIMVLIYMNSLLLLIGFELNVSIKSLKIKAAERAV